MIYQVKNEALEQPYKLSSLHLPQLMLFLVSIVLLLAVHTVLISFG